MEHTISVQPIFAGAQLAPYACHPERSRGRRIFEPCPPTRTEFQRDRDRIVHSSAFRRLVYKTQVFLNHEGDMFRTRLTHSLEVAQVARSIARPLGLNEDLVEAVSLAHDLGHTPFGHAGQDELHECMSDYGGFEHNIQSLRVVDYLEQRYPEFGGLNLTFEAREGILKHCSQVNARKIEAQEPAGVAARFLQGQSPNLEAQLCNLADSIAYNAHDIDDGVRSGLLKLDDLMEQPLFARHYRKAGELYPQLRQEPQRWLYEAIRRMLSSQIYDVIETTQALLRQYQPDSVDAVRQMPPLVRFSESVKQEAKDLKHFMFHQLYRHPKVVQQTNLARQIIRELFALYLADARLMKPDYTNRVERLRQSGMAPVDIQPAIARVVADYIAGMTDRYATREHARLMGVQILGLDTDSE